MSCRARNPSVRSQSRGVQPGTGTQGSPRGGDAHPRVADAGHAVVIHGEQIVGEGQIDTDPCPGVVQDRDQHLDDGEVEGIRGREVLDEVVVGHPTEQTRAFRCDGGDGAGLQQPHLLALDGPFDVHRLAVVAFHPLGQGSDPTDLAVGDGWGSGIGDRGGTGAAVGAKIDAGGLVAESPPECPSHGVGVRGDGSGDHRLPEPERGLDGDDVLPGEGGLRQVLGGGGGTHRHRTAELRRRRQELGRQGFGHGVAESGAVGVSGEAEAVRNR